MTGLAVLALLPFAGIFSSIPSAVLAAVVIVAVAPMIRLRADPRPVAGLPAAVRRRGRDVRCSRSHSRRTSSTAVLAGVALAVAVHLWRELRLDIDVAARGDTLDLHPRGVIWFGTAPGLEDRLVRVLADHPDARRLVIHLDGVGRLRPQRRAGPAQRVGVRT